MKFVVTFHLSIINFNIRYIKSIYIIIIKNTGNPNKGLEFRIIMLLISIRYYWHSISFEIVCNFQYLFWA